MKSTLLALLLSLALGGSLSSTQAQAAGMSGTQMGTEERFQDLFLTAGYCTAFGAALGTAMLAFTTNPTENLRFVAVGASLGFIGGSALGSYIILSPLLTDAGNDHYTGSLASEGRMPTRGLVIRPAIDRSTHRLVSIEGGLTLASF
ncbi:MAG: hypothetical protein FJ146_15030 [Deltaproteobacteria bacterium]|nr:hypothetical protein [Deltaproteobacteria bacterium]